MKRLNDLFTLQAFNDCKIVAGKNGLERIVEFVNISDTPDIAKFLKSNELLLTTGYGFKEDNKLLTKFISHLAEINVSGLIIKENRFIKKIPKEAIDIANKLNFPVMLLTGNQTLGELSNKIISFLSGYKSEELFYAIHLQKKFTEMMMKGFDVDYLIDRLSLSINTPIILIDDRFDIVSNSKSIKCNNELVINNIINLIKFDVQKYKNIHNGEIANPKSLDKLIFSTFPVATVYDKPNILIILNSNEMLHPLSDVAIEQVIHALSFALVKKQISNENSNKIKSNFFSDMINGRISDNEAFVKKGSTYGLKDNCKYICVTGSFDVNNPYKNTTYIPQNKTYFASSYIIDTLEKEAKLCDLDVIAFTHSNYFIIILQVNRYNDNIKISIESYLKKLQNKVDDDMSISFGISAPIRSINQIKDSYLNSLEALNYGYDSERTSFIEYYKLKEPKDILFMLPDRVLVEYCESILKDLVCDSSKENEDLLETLKAFIDNRFDISKTSRVLFIHRNTVKYRISKCEEILNLSLQNPDDVFSIQLALQIKFISNNKTNS